jgi:hypothetical protein
MPNAIVSGVIIELDSVIYCLIWIILMVFGTH